MQKVEDRLQSGAPAAPAPAAPADSKSAEEGGLWVAVRVAIVQGAVWGVPWCLRGRSKFKNHHSHTCKTTSAPREWTATPKESDGALISEQIFFV